MESVVVQKAVVELVPASTRAAWRWLLQPGEQLCQKIVEQVFANPQVKIRTERANGHVPQLANVIDYRS